MKTRWLEVFSISLFGIVYQITATEKIKVDIKNGTAVECKAEGTLMAKSIKDGLFVAINIHKGTFDRNDGKGILTIDEVDQFIGSTEAKGLTSYDVVITETTAAKWRGEVFNSSEREFNNVPGHAIVFTKTKSANQ